MNIYHIVPHIDDEASGPSYSVKKLCEHLNLLNCDINLLVIKRGKEKNDNIIKSFKSKNILNKLDYSPDLQNYLSNNSKKISLIHNHGLWSMPNHYGFRAAKKFKIPIICAPRGTLSKWSLSHSKLKKALYWKFIEKNNLKNVDIFHATSELEASEIRDLGFKQPIAVIPNGVETLNHSHKKFNKKKNKLIYFARIHKKKGIELLIDSWNRISGSLNNWELIIAGKGEPKYQNFIESKISKLNLDKIKFLGPLYGKKKYNFLADGDIYILPTYSENFGLTIAESLSCGTPVITTKDSSWSNIENKSIGWLISTDENFSERLFKILKYINFDKLEIMSSNSKKYIMKNYNWDKISKNTYDLYKWAINRKTKKPHFIYE